MTTPTEYAYEMDSSLVFFKTILAINENSSLQLYKAVDSISISSI